MELIDSVTPANAQAVKVQIDALKWFMSKLDGASYGDRPDEVHVNTTVNNTILTPEKLKELQERKQKALGR